MLSLRSWMVLAAFALLGWAVFWPYPLWVLAGVLLAWPWLVVVLIATVGGRLTPPPMAGAVADPERPTTSLLRRLWQGPARRRRNPLPVIGGLIGIPVMALIWAAVFGGGHFLDLEPLAPYGAGLGVALIAAGWIVDKSVSLMKGGRLWLIGLGLAYGAAAAPLIDQAFDHGAVQLFQTTVTRRYATSGAYGAYHHVDLAAWGPLTAASNEADVGSVIYNRLSEGGPACVTLHPGLLRARWYEVAPCGDAVPPTFLPGL